MIITGTKTAAHSQTRWETTMPDGGVEAAIEAIRGALPRALRGRATTTFGAETPQDWERPFVGDAPFWEVRVDLHDKGWGPVVGWLRPHPGGRLTWRAWTAYAEGDESYWPKEGGWPRRAAGPVAPLPSPLPRRGRRQSPVISRRRPSRTWRPMRSPRTRSGRTG